MVDEGRARFIPTASLQQPQEASSGFPYFSFTSCQGTISIFVHLQCTHGSIFVCVSLSYKRFMDTYW